MPRDDDEFIRTLIRWVEARDDDQTTLLATGADIPDAGILRVVREPGFCDPEHLILRVTDELGESETYLSPDNVRDLALTLIAWLMR